MDSLARHSTESQCSRLRAMIEIVDGELKVYPIADTDEDERRILDGLRFFREELAER